MILLLRVDDASIVLQAQNLGLSSLIVQYMDGAESIHLRYCTHGPETPALLRCGRRGATLHESFRAARHQAAAAEPADQAVGTGIGNTAIPPSDARCRAYRARDITARRGAANSGAGGTDKGKCSKSSARRNGT